MRDTRYVRRRRRCARSLYRGSSCGARPFGVAKVASTATRNREASGGRHEEVAPISAHGFPPGSALRDESTTRAVFSFRLPARRHERARRFADSLSFACDARFRCAAPRVSRVTNVFLDALSSKMQVPCALLLDSRPISWHRRMTREAYRWGGGGRGFLE